MIVWGLIRSQWLDTKNIQQYSNKKLYWHTLKEKDLKMISVKNTEFGQEANYGNGL